MALDFRRSDRRRPSVPSLDRRLRFLSAVPGGDGRSRAGDRRTQPTGRFRRRRHPSTIVWERPLRRRAALSVRPAGGGGGGCSLKHTENTPSTSRQTHPTYARVTYRRMLQAKRLIKYIFVRFSIIIFIVRNAISYLQRRVRIVFIP